MARIPLIERSVSVRQDVRQNVMSFTTLQITIMKCDSCEYSKRWLSEASLAFHGSISQLTRTFVPGLIYRHYRPVHYSPSSRSALAEAELVYKDDHVSHSVYVTFDLDTKSHDSSVAFRNLVAGHTKIQLLVWTTTPWTLTANMVRTSSRCAFIRSHVYVQGIAVHPDMTYTLIRPAELPNDSEGASVLIVAQERLEALSKVIGKAELVAQIRGRSISYRFAAHAHSHV
jgi:isoleucyl-tRNA synthetase